MVSLNIVLRKLESIESVLRRISNDSAETKTDVKELKCELNSMKRSISTGTHNAPDQSSSSNVYTTFRGVLPAPNKGRSSKETSFFSVGKALKEAIDVYNNSAKESNLPLIPQVTQTPLSFSRAIMKSAERCLTACKVFGSHVRKSTYKEVKSAYNEDLVTFQQAYENNVRKLVRLHPVLAAAEGQWAADAALRRRLIVMKDNNTTVLISAEADVDWTCDNFNDHEQTEDSVSDSDNFLRNEACALHKRGSTCDMCCDDEEMILPLKVFNTRNAPLSVDISIYAEDETEEENDEEEILASRAHDGEPNKLKRTTCKVLKNRDTSIRSTLNRNSGDPPHSESKKKISTTSNGEKEMSIHGRGELKHRRITTKKKFNNPIQSDSDLENKENGVGHRVRSKKRKEIPLRHISRPSGTKEGVNPKRRKRMSFKTDGDCDE